MINVKVSGVPELKRYFEALAKNQLPFATAKALTKTAQDVQAAVIAKLPGQFTLRTQWYKPNTPFGFKVDRATKQNPIARVYTRAPWMQLQETGGVKAVAGKRLAVPTTQVRRTKRDLIPKNQRPRAIAMAFPLQTKRGTTILAVRVGRGRKSILKLMYTLTPKANVPARLHFAETAGQVVDSKWRANFENAIDHALRTAR